MVTEEGEDVDEVVQALLQEAEVVDVAQVVDEVRDVEEVQEEGGVADEAQVLPVEVAAETTVREKQVDGTTLMTKDVVPHQTSNQRVLLAQLFQKTSILRRNLIFSSYSSHQLL